MKSIEEHNGTGYIDISDRTIFILIAVVAILAILFVCLGGCINTSAMTGSKTSAKLKAEQQSSQETTSTDKVRLEIPQSTITFTDRAGSKTIVSCGGGKAETGSTTLQQSDQLSEIKQEVKASSEASSKSSFSLTVLLVIAGFIALILLLFELYRIKKGIF